MQPSVRKKGASISELVGMQGLISTTLLEAKNFQYLLSVLYFFII